MKLIFKFYFFLFSLYTASPLSFASEKNFHFESFSPENETESGCGCSVTNSKGELLLVSDLKDHAPATIRVEGKNKILKWISSTEKKGMPALGAIFTRVYEDGSLKLKINYKVKSVCAKSDESCEVTQYSVDLFLEQGAKKAELKTLNADCGC